MLHDRHSRISEDFPTTEGGEKRAVDGITFSVDGGEIYGLLGPNGAGKTTTLRILSGLISATSGSAILNGFDVSKEREQVKRSLGFLNASMGLYQRLTPRELLRYFGRLHGLEGKALAQRVAELVDWLEMEPFANLRCGGLSTGQRQRVSIARAMIADPPILILDEPTLGLDVITNRLVLDFIRGEGERGKTIILSTHYLDEAETICNRFGLIYEGKLIAEGALADLRQRTGKERLSEIFLNLCGEDHPVLARRRLTALAPHEAARIFAMNLHGAWVVFIKELLDVLRDRRTLIAMVLVPMVLLSGACGHHASGRSIRERPAGARNLHHRGARCAPSRLALGCAQRN